MNNLVNKYIILIVALVSVLVTFSITSLSYKNEIKEMKLNEANDALEYSKKVIELNDKYTNMENKLNEDSKTYENKIKKLKIENSTIANNYANGTNELRVKLKSCERTNSSSNKSSFLDDGGTTTGIVDADTSRRVVEVMTKADQYKTQLEALQNYIKQYNKEVQK